MSLSVLFGVLTPLYMPYILLCAILLGAFNIFVVCLSKKTKV